MTKTRVRVTSCLLWGVFTLLGFYSPNPAKAETYTATQTQRDFYFVSETPMNMTVRTYAQQYGIDSMLWVYGENDVLITANDDYFGLDSFVSFQMQPNVSYRLRAGVCCWNPEAWYGNSYLIEPSMTPINAPIQTTTTTVEPTTTLPEPSTTSEPPTTTTTELTTTTTSSTTTTTTVPETTTTIQRTTTTIYDPPVVVTTTTTVPETTTSQPILPTTTTEPEPAVVSTTTTSSSSTTSTTVVVPTTTTTTTFPEPTTTVPTTTSSLISPTTTVPISPSMPPTVALAVATSAEALKTITPDEAAQVFEALEVSELSEEEAQELVSAVQEAPDTVRAEFEDKVNVFDNKFNSYVPLGSTINVGQRKVLIAATGVLFMAPTVPTTSGSAPSNSRRK